MGEGAAPDGSAASRSEGALAARRAAEARPGGLPDRSRRAVPAPERPGQGDEGARRRPGSTRTLRRSGSGRGGDGGAGCGLLVVGGEHRAHFEDEARRASAPARAVASGQATSTGGRAMAPGLEGGQPQPLVRPRRRGSSSSRPATLLDPPLRPSPRPTGKRRFAAGVGGGRASSVERPVLDRGRRRVTCPAASGRRSERRRLAACAPRRRAAARAGERGAAALTAQPPPALLEERQDGSGI